jgi:hypothetical protein
VGKARVVQQPCAEFSRIYSNVQRGVCNNGLIALFVFSVVNRRLAARGKLISERALRVEHDLLPVLAFDASMT